MFTARYQTKDARQKQREYNRRHYLKKKHEQHRLDEKKVLLSCRVPEWMVGRLQRIMSEGLVTGRYPCKTMSETVQWMLRRAFKDMEDDPVVGGMMKFAEAERAIGELARSRKEAMGLLNKASDEVSHLIDIGDHDEALRYFHRACEAMRDLEPGIWTDIALKQFKAKYPELAKLAKSGKIPQTDFIGRGLKYGARMERKGEMGG